MKPIHAAQYRASGPTQGMRMLRHIQGRHCWHMKVWLTYSPEHAPIDIVDGEPRRREGELSQFRVPEPCLPSELVPIYEAAIKELCQGTPVVIAAGFDAYVLPGRPPQRQTNHHNSRPLAA